MKIQARFAMLVPVHVIRELKVTLVGVGAIGSHVAVNLAKSGFAHFDLVDHDKVELENVGVQAYHKGHVGKRKVDAARELIELNSEGKVTVRTHGVKFMGESTLPRGADIVIVSPDNIKCREAVYGALRMRGKKGLHIDARMGPEMFEVWVNKFGEGNKKLTEDGGYKESFHARVPPMPCGMQGLPHTGPMAAAYITAIVKEYVTGGAVKDWQAMTIGAGNRGITEGDDV